MKQHYNARDRTVLKNSRDGVQLENLHTKELKSLSKKEKDYEIHSNKVGKIEQRDDGANRHGTVRAKRKYQHSRFTKPDKDVNRIEARGNDVTQPPNRFNPESDVSHEDRLSPASEITVPKNVEDQKAEEYEHTYENEALQEHTHTTGSPSKNHRRHKLQEYHFGNRLHRGDTFSSDMNSSYQDRVARDNNYHSAYRHSEDRTSDSATSPNHAKGNFYQKSKNRYYRENKEVDSSAKSKRQKKYRHSDKTAFSDEARDNKTHRMLHFHSERPAESILTYEHDEESDTDDISDQLTRKAGIAARTFSRRIYDSVTDRQGRIARSGDFRFSRAGSGLKFGAVLSTNKPSRQTKSVPSAVQSLETAHINPTQKALQKKRYQKGYQQAKKRGISSVAAYFSGNPTHRALSRQGDNSIAKVVSTITGGRKSLAGIVAVILLLFTMVISSFSGCVAIIGGGMSVMASTYPGKTEEITGVDEAYCNLEDDLDTQINEIERTHPGYDEYRYQVDEITHNPFQLTSMLSARFGSYTLSDVMDELSVILNLQYTLSVTEEVETRTRTVTDPETGEETVEEYDYYILNISLTNHGLDYVSTQYLSDDQQRMYAAYNAVLGNRKELFDETTLPIGSGGGIAVLPTDGGYEIPPEALSDERFRNMIGEAEKYLGYPYVWGGASPSTSFDCSGFVSWVINNCGNGWSYGRRTAEGLRNLCSYVSPSEAKPGDLIFFQGTYNTSGASHVGIYVGNGMMIHCGDPIQYTSINTAYWQGHFFQFGRIP